MALIDELKERADKLDAEMLALSGRIKEIERESDAVHICINALDIAEMDEERAANADFDMAALEAPAQPVHPDELRDAPPAASEESGDQSEGVRRFTEEVIRSETRDPGEVPAPEDAAEDFTLLDPAVLRDEPAPLIDAQTCEEVDPRVSWSVDDTEGYAPVVDAEPVLDATELAQVTIDKVPPTAEVIKDQNGRAKFALFGGQTHEVVEPSNTEADFWARALFPKKKEQA